MPTHPINFDMGFINVVSLVHTLHSLSIQSSGFASRVHMPHFFLVELSDSAVYPLPHTLGPPPILVCLVLPQSYVSSCTTCWYRYRQWAEYHKYIVYTWKWLSTVFSITEDSQWDHANHWVSFTDGCFCKSISPLTMGCYLHLPIWLKRWV